MSSQTPNLNLVLPVGTEKVSRQIINDNNTKIDTAVGNNSDAIANINGKLLKQISVTSISDLETQLNTIGSGMSAGAFQNICISTGASMTVLNANDRFVGQITKTYDDRYQVWLNRNAGNDVTHGTKTSTGWVWTELVTKSMSSGDATINSSYFNTSTAKVHWEKVGRTVTVYFEDLNLSQQLTGNITVFSGLPSPSTVAVFALCDYANNKAYRHRIGYDGTVTNYWSTIPANTILFGVLTYFTN